MTERAASVSHAPRLGPLALGALGVVFGDIGTSPLYALKECVSRDHGVAPTPDNVYGLLSLVFWALTMVVAVKYLTFIMRADNDGEGGILALLALVPESLRIGKRGGAGLVAVLVLFGAALLYGDGIITPAISVLSAVEGLKVATPALARFVVPITCTILLGLFAIQRRGTARIGRVFGPIMAVWFVTIAALGAMSIARSPSVLRALLPTYAVRFCLSHGFGAFVILGSVVLAVTGGEALYADMGHFGRAPIRLAWYALVMPSLVLNYFGQGALLLADGAGRDNPFFALVPSGALTYALVGLSAAATVIASQALISGAFSLTRQAVQLGYLPRVAVRHTSSETEGQIYIGTVNWLLALSCVALVLGFRQSSRLASAYGIAVTGTMAITSIVYFVVVRQDWKWPLWKALPPVAIFLAWDLAFFGANALKLVDGGYVPVLVAMALFAVMMIWHRGRSVLSRRLAASQPTVEEVVAEIDREHYARVPGTGIFLTGTHGLPAVLPHYIRLSRVLPERVVLLHVEVERAPRVAIERSVHVEPLGHGFFRITVRTGFMERPRLPERLRLGATSAPLALDAATTYFIGFETFLRTSQGEMGPVTESIFSFLYRNASSATAYFGLPAERVMELGMQIDL